MIDLKSLRIGNLIEGTQLGGGYYCVTATKENGFVVEGFEFHMPYERNDGIPLTPEILEKCGFKFNVLMAGHNNIIWYNDHIGIKGMLGIVKPQKCKYLHELQNLFYCMSGKELDIKL